MKDIKISFIGGGNMTRSIVGGLLKNDWRAENICISDPNENCLSELLKINSSLITSNNNAQAVDFGEVVLFAVKPQVLSSVVKPLSNHLQQQKPLIISIAAGVSIDSISSWAGGNQAIVRCMPNTPALVESGASGLLANNSVSDDQKTIAESLLRAVGIAVWLNSEEEIDIVTALSGSGPAYYFLFMEAMQSAAEKMGLSTDIAKLLSLQTAFGASKLALESDIDFATLRERVTSKGGTTAAALEKFDQLGLPSIIALAMQAAADRSHELSIQTGTS